MKKLLLFTILIFISSFLTAQSLQILYEDKVLDPFETVTVAMEVTSVWDEIAVKFDVQNTSSKTMTVNVKKVENYLIDSTYNTFCWAFFCYGPDDYVSPNSVSILSNETHTNDFSSYYKPMGHFGESSVSYVFYDLNNPSDSVMATVIYSPLVDISSNRENEIIISEPYPNPVNNVVNFNYDLPSMVRAKIIIYSLVGSVVKEVTFSDNAGKLSIPADDLDEGFYFYRLSDENNELKSGKFIIKR